jgi:hypothetical protein
MWENAEDLRQLRSVCQQVLLELNKQNLLEKHFPFFYFCGQGTKYLDLAKGNGSPIGSCWLLLKPLEVEHLRQVMIESTLDQNVAFPFFAELTPNEQNKILEIMVFLVLYSMWVIRFNNYVLRIQIIYYL